MKMPLFKISSVQTSQHHTLYKQPSPAGTSQAWPQIKHHHHQTYSASHFCHNCMLWLVCYYSLKKKKKIIEKKLFGGKTGALWQQVGKGCCVL